MTQWCVHTVPQGVHKQGGLGQVGRSPLGMMSTNTPPVAPSPPLSFHTPTQLKVVPRSMPNTKSLEVGGDARAGGSKAAMHPATTAAMAAAGVHMRFFWVFGWVKEAVISRT
jgi:hypothetical protein